jgi:cob(I)alamin adenosyltransferase
MFEVETKVKQEARRADHAPAQEKVRGVQKAACRIEQPRTEIDSIATEGWKASGWQTEGCYLSVVRSEEKYDREVRLLSGLRIDKDSPTMEAMGTIAEVISMLTLLEQFDQGSVGSAFLSDTARRLSRMSDQVSAGGSELLSPQDCEWMGDAIRQVQATISAEKANWSKEPLAPAYASIARSVCGRAERRLLTLLDLSTTGFELGDYPAENLNWDDGLIFLSRLSELLALLATIK